MLANACREASSNPHHISQEIHSRTRPVSVCKAVSAKVWRARRKCLPIGLPSNILSVIFIFLRRPGCDRRSEIEARTDTRRQQKDGVSGQDPAIEPYDLDASLSSRVSLGRESFSFLVSRIVALNRSATNPNGSQSIYARHTQSQERKREALRYVPTRAKHPWLRDEPNRLPNKEVISDTPESRYLLSTGRSRKLH